ncbi:MAG: glycosyltransferase family 2 protein, partial [Acidobacteriota bacterium]|nr:glycosyltransferase family 2 protein [Acidobacteriota bacterium]
MGPPVSPAPRLTAADVAIVVPVGGAAPAWARAAASLGRLSPPPGEVVAVIDGADGALAATAASIGAAVLMLEERGGPARARNRGARATDRAILLFVDADVEVPVDLAARVAALFTAHPEVAAMFGSYDATPAAPGLVSQYRNLQHHFVHQTSREAASTFWAGCGAIRREAFERVGGFDESWTEPSIEDIELGARLVRTGQTIRLVKDLQVTHLKQWRLANMLATDLWRRAVPWTELMLRDGRLIDDLNVKHRDRLSVVLAFVALVALAAGWRSPLWLGACVA